MPFSRASKQQTTFLSTNSLLEINYTRSKVTRLLEIKYLQMLCYTCVHRKLLSVRIQEFLQAIVVLSLDEIWDRSLRKRKIENHSSSSMRHKLGLQNKSVSLLSFYVCNLSISIKINHQGSSYNVVAMIDPLVKYNWVFLSLSTWLLFCQNLYQYPISVSYKGCDCLQARIKVSIKSSAYVVSSSLDFLFLICSK